MTDETNEEVVDTLAEPAESGNAVEVGDDSIAEAGAKLLASLGEAANKPFDTVDSTDEDSDSYDDDEENAEDEDSEEPEAEKPTAKADEEADPAESGKAIVVKLPGHKERGEKALEIEIDDPEVAERLRRLAKDGMRASDFAKAEARIKSERAELDDIKTHLQVAPEQWILAHVSPERKLSLAKALNAELFENEDLQNEFNELADETTRRERKLDLREKQHEAEQEVETARAKRDYAHSVLDAVAALVPDGIDRETHRRFLDDAERDLMTEVSRGVTITPQNVKEVLEYRIRMYGFGKGKAVRGRRESDTARPASDRARDIANSTSQDRRKNAIVRRRFASAAGSPGAGAVATRPPAAPKGSDIESASAHALASIKKQGGSGDTW